MAKRIKERAPTSVTHDIITEDTAAPAASDMSAVDAGLDEAFGPEEGTTPPEPAPDSGTPAGDTPPEGAPEDKKPPTGPRKAAAPAGEVTPPSEGVPATPPTAQAPAPAVDPNAPPHDPEIDGIQAPTGMNPANQQNFKNLREVARKYKELANQHAAEADDFKSKVGKLPPEIEKELEENRTFRRMFDITNDQEFKTKFDKPSEEAQDEIITLMKKHGATDEHVKLLKDKGIASLPDKWWEDNVLKPLRDSDNTDENTAAIVIKQRLEKVRALAYERQKEVEKASGSQSEFLKKRDEETKAKEEADIKIMQNRVLEIQAQVPWAKLQEIPKNATPEQKAQIEAENKFYKETEERFTVALNPPDAQTKVETAIAACLSFKLHQDLTAEKAITAQLRSEIAKLKGANVIKASPSIPVNKAVSNRYDPKTKDSDAFDLAADEAGL